MSTLMTKPTQLTSAFDLEALPSWSVVRADNDVFQKWPTVMTGSEPRWITIGKGDYQYTDHEVWSHGTVVELLAYGRQENERPGSRRPLLFRNPRGRIEHLTHSGADQTLCGISTKFGAKYSPADNNADPKLRPLCGVCQKENEK